MTSHLNLYFHTSSCTLWVIRLILLFCCCDQTSRHMEETCRAMRPSWQEAWQQVAGMATGTGSGGMTSTTNVKQEEWGGSGSRLYNTQSPPLAMYFLQQAVLSQNCITNWGPSIQISETAGDSLFQTTILVWEMRQKMSALLSAKRISPSQSWEKHIMGEKIHFGGFSPLWEGGCRSHHGS